MIDSVRVARFKSLYDTGWIDVKPLTVLVGPNSSGKSSLIQLLLMLKQTAESPDYDVPLLSNGPLVQLGNYPDFIFGGDSRMQLRFGMKFTTPPGLFRSESSTEELSRLCSFEAAFTYSSKNDEVRLRDSFFDIEGGISASIRRKGRAARYTLEYSTVHTKTGAAKQFDVRPYSFHRFGVVRREGEQAIRYPHYDLVSIGHGLERELHAMYYIGPLRESPKRVYFSTGIRPTDVGTRGEKTVDVLWSAHRATSQRLLKTKDKVDAWFRAFGFANRLRVLQLGSDNVYRVEVLDPNTNLEVNLSDIGFGASQTLPIIVESFLAPERSMLLVEQPEIHLHPKAQCMLGDMFIDAAIPGTRRFIIETHSEHLLARIRRRIVDPQSPIKAADVAIYYFRPSTDGTYIVPVTLNDMGQYEDFPQGFFDEDVNEAFEHLRLISEKTQHE